MYYIVQAMGRIARAHPDKAMSTVFDIYDDCSYMTKPRAGNFPTLMENYSVQHWNTRNTYYIDQRLPVTEFSLEGIYEASVNPDDLENRKKVKKEEALEKAKKKKAKGKKKKTPTNTNTNTKKVTLAQQTQFDL